MHAREVHAREIHAHEVHTLEVCGLSFVISMRSGIGSGPLRFVPLEWLSTTGRPARLTKRRQIAHSLNLSSNTLFPVGY